MNQLIDYSDIDDTYNLTCNSNFNSLPTTYRNIFYVGIPNLHFQPNMVIIRQIIINTNIAFSNSIRTVLIYSDLTNGYIGILNQMNNVNNPPQQQLSQFSSIINPNTEILIKKPIYGINFTLYVTNAAGVIVPYSTGGTAEFISISMDFIKFKNNNNLKTSVR